MHYVAVLVEALILWFTLRRVALIVGAIVPRRPLPMDGPATLPSVAVLVAARDEESNLPALFDALDHLDYPSGQVTFSIASNGSSDGTAGLLQAWERSRCNVLGYVLETPGKAAALSLALASAPPSDLIVTFDADTPPRPDCLRRLVPAFADARVAAAGGYCAPANATESIVSRYSALEYWVHHLVNLSGKDRWNLGPIPSANIAGYRRAALVKVGGFLPGVADDVSTAMRLLAAGYQTRYVVDAIVDTPLVTTLHQFTAQRRRWSANLNYAAGSVRGLETLSVAAGYLDRIVFVLCLALAVGGWVRVPFLLIYPGVLLVATITAVARAGHARRILEFLGVALLMAPVDVWLSLPPLNRSRIHSWKPPGRSGALEK
jgi:cellulose synthase/poly-beta-1,6-N-acetylglucosamine synthase-like glycosyltransferase